MIEKYLSNRNDVISLNNLRVESTQGMFLQIANFDDLMKFCLEFDGTWV